MTHEELQRERDAIVRVMQSHALTIGPDLAKTLDNALTFTEILDAQPPATSHQPPQSPDPNLNQAIRNLIDSKNKALLERDELRQKCSELQSEVNGWKHTCNSLRAVLDLAEIRTRPGGTIVEAAYYVGADRIEWLPIDEWKRRRRDAAIAFDKHIPRGPNLSNAEISKAIDMTKHLPEPASLRPGAPSHEQHTERELRQYGKPGDSPAAFSLESELRHDAPPAPKPPDWPKFLIGFDEDGDRTIFVYVSDSVGGTFYRDGEYKRAQHGYRGNLERVGKDMRIADTDEVRRVAAAFEGADPNVTTAAWIRTYLKKKGMPLALDVTFATQAPPCEPLTPGHRPASPVELLRAVVADPTDDDYRRVNAIGDIINERNRQVYDLGHTPARDDLLGNGHLEMRAVAYASRLSADGGTRRADLVKGAALLLAAIEKLDREHARLQKGYRDLEKGPM